MFDKEVKPPGFWQTVVDTVLGTRLPRKQNFVRLVLVGVVLLILGAVVGVPELVKVFKH
jgi:hypothetical protein